MPSPAPLSSPSPGTTLAGPLAPMPPALQWREAHGGADRHRLEALVRQRFATEHGARIRHFLPRLFGLWQDGEPLAAVGVRDATSGSLFQEHYLDSRAETFLATRLGHPVARGEIAEIGNLASRQPGLQRRLFLHLVEQLTPEGTTWLLFTATAAVYRGIQRLGLALELHPLMPADPARLGDDQADWGRYYDQRPWVMTGNLRRAHQELTARGYLPTSRQEVRDARRA